MGLDYISVVYYVIVSFIQHIYKRFPFEKEIYIGPNAKPFFDFLKCMVVNHFLNVRSLEARYRHQILIFCLANAMIIIW